jgi:hypothetical protein
MDALRSGDEAEIVSAHEAAIRVQDPILAISRFEDPTAIAAARAADAAVWATSRQPDAHKRAAMAAVWAATMVSAAAVDAARAAVGMTS